MFFISFAFWFFEFNLINGGFGEMWKGCKGVVGNSSL